MPLPKHTVQPVKVSQVPVPVDKVDNELEFVANATLCNLMRQMASISRLATDMFDELTALLLGLAERTMRLQNRLALLHTDIQTIEKGEEDLSNLPPMQLVPFCSKKPLDSRFLSRNTIPASLRACYERADAPPPLDQMDALRDDNHSTMTLYSDPDFFFETWSHNMLRDSRHKGITKRKRIKPRNKSVGVGKRLQAQNKPQMVIQQTGVGGGTSVPPATAIEQMQYSLHEPHCVTPSPSSISSHPSSLLPPPPPPPPPSMTPYTQLDNFAINNSDSPHLNGRFNGPYTDYSLSTANAFQHPPPPSPPSKNADIPFRRTPPTPPGDSGKSTTSALSSDLSHELPPPPPPAPIFDNEMSQHITASGPFLSSPCDNHVVSSSMPPPPPPPPPAPLPASTNIEGMLNQLSHLTVAVSTTIADPRQDLMSAIRAGLQLRKVSDQSNNGPSQKNSISSMNSKHRDVQAIYEAVLRKRRECIEGTSDDEDGRSSSSGWSD